MRISALVLFEAFLIAAVYAGEPVYAGGGTIVGTGVGAAVGGLVGSQIGQGSGQLAATGAGVAIGGLIGHEVGHEVDSDSTTKSGGAPIGNSSVFSDPSSPYGTYTPNYVAPPAPPPTYVDENAGTYCRPYSQEIRVDGQIKENYGTACLQADGSWRIVP